MTDDDRGLMRIDEERGSVPRAVVSPAPSCGCPSPRRGPPASRRGAPPPATHAHMAVREGKGEERKGKGIGPRPRHGPLASQRTSACNTRTHGGQGGEGRGGGGEGEGERGKRRGGGRGVIYPQRGPPASRRGTSPPATHAHTAVREGKGEEGEGRGGKGRGGGRGHLSSARAARLAEPGLRLQHGCQGRDGKGIGMGKRKGEESER